MTVRLPPRSDESAFIAAVMARVGTEIRREIRRIRRRRAPSDTLAAILARLEPLSIPGALPPGAGGSTGAAGIPPPAAPAPACAAEAASARRRPDFLPDFSSHVKHPATFPYPSCAGLTRVSTSSEPQKAYGRRTDCARLLAVSLDWFDRNVARMMRDEAFPRERAGGGQRRWPLAAVVQWANDPAHDLLLHRARNARAKTRRFAP